MLIDDHLILRWVRLKSSEAWTNGGQGFYFLFPAGGTGIYSARAMAQPLQPGDVLVLNDDASGQLRVSSSDQMEFWWFFASTEQLLPLFTAYEICRLREILSSLGRAKLYPAGTTTASECHRLLTEMPYQGSLTHRTRLLAIIAVILAHEFTQTQMQASAGNGQDDRLQTAFEQLSTSELLGLSVNELATRFSCGRRHLNRLFHQRFGISVAALRMELRMLKSVSLLRDPGSKVFNVARQCGFSSVSHFSKCFVRRFGRSPGQWREELPTLSSTAESHDPLLRCRLGSIVVCPLSDQFVKGQEPLPKAGPDLVPSLNGHRAVDSPHRLRIVPQAKQKACVIPVVHASAKDGSKPVS